MIPVRVEGLLLGFVMLLCAANKTVLFHLCSPW
jgi:hypothetical protein